MADIYIDTLTYLKTEIDTKMSENMTAVSNEMATKADKASLGSPSGIATLDSSGQLNEEQLPSGYTGDLVLDGRTLTFYKGRLTGVV